MQIFYPDEKGSGGEWWHGEIVSKKEQPTGGLPQACQASLEQYKHLDLWERFEIEWDGAVSMYF